MVSSGTHIISINRYYYRKKILFKTGISRWGWRVLVCSTRQRGYFTTEMMNGGNKKQTDPWLVLLLCLISLQTMHPLILCNMDLLLPLPVPLGMPVFLKQIIVIWEYPVFFLWHNWLAGKEQVKKSFPTPCPCTATRHLNWLWVKAKSDKVWIL